MAAVCAAVVVSGLAGCGGGGDGPQPASPVSGAAPAGKDKNGDTAPAGPEEPAGDDGTGTDGLTGETVPDEELAAPDGGSFTAAEREYLSENVPVGVEPGVVLEAGEEACHQLGYLERHDPPAAVARLRDGTIPYADDAVTALCPEYEGLLERARGKDE